MYALKELYQQAASPAEYIAGYNQHFISLIAQLDADAIAEVVGVIEAAAAEGRTIFVVANGGSAAVASHFVNDMGVNSLVPERHGFRVLSLADNVESVAAVANDAGYEYIFEYQLRCNMMPGDVVIALSVSGNSPNVIRAIEYANANGAQTVGFCGFDGGRLAQTAQRCIHAPSTRDEYGPVEDIFSVLFHIISGYLTMKRGRFLHH